MTKVDKPAADAFRARIKKETADRGWTQAMLAAKMVPIGNEQTVSRLLNGNRPISAMMAGQMINALGLAGDIGHAHIIACCHWLIHITRVFP